MNNQWQNKLRDRMERHEESAPEGLWDRIEQIMSAEVWLIAHPRNGILSRYGAYAS